MGLSGFHIRPVSGLDIADVGGLNGPKPLRSPSKMVGCEAPHHFGWVLQRIRAVLTSKIGDLRSRNRPDLKTRQSNFQTYLTLNVWFVLGPGGLREAPEGSRKAYGWPCGAKFGWKPAKNQITIIISRPT